MGQRKEEFIKGRKDQPFKLYEERVERLYRCQFLTTTETFRHHIVRTKRQYT